jgi:hypothetical protein
MSIFAYIDDSSIITRIVNADDEQSAKYTYGLDNGLSIIDVTNSTKCENFYAVGRIYVPDSDAVLPAKIFPSWVIANDGRSWIPPVVQTDSDTVWDEESQTWVLPNS